MIVSGSNIRDHVAQKFIDIHNCSTSDFVINTTVYLYYLEKTQNI